MKKKEYYHTKESVEEYIKLAKDVNGRQLIARFAEFVHSGSTVLEIGSGPGTDWGILSEKYEVIGSDNSLIFLDHLQVEHPEGVFIQLDAATLETTRSFDGIFSNKVMHHLTDDELASSAERQHDILNEDGVICHSFWKGDGSEWFKGLFVNYHEIKSLREIFQKYFDIISIEPYAEFEQDDSLLLIGRRI